MRPILGAYRRETTETYIKAVPMETNRERKKNNPIKKWAKEMNRHIPKEYLYAANSHMKKCSS